MIIAITQVCMKILGIQKALRVKLEDILPKKKNKS